MSQVGAVFFVLGSPFSGTSVRGGFPHLLGMGGASLRFCVFLRDVATLWVKGVFSSLLLAIVGFLFG